MNQWYVACGKVKMGPYSLAQLKVAKRDGTLRPNDMVLQVGAQKWKRASEIAGLFSAEISRPAEKIPIAQPAPVKIPVALVPTHPKHAVEISSTSPVKTRPAKRRHPTNAAVIVSAMVAEIAASFWLFAFLEVINSPVVALSGAGLVLIFFSSVFGGMYASSLTGVARFRHSLYAGLCACAIRLIVILPIALLIFLTWRAFSGPAGSVQLPVGPILVGLIMVPFVSVIGYLFGGGFDLVATAVLRNSFPRQKWTYYTRAGKSFPVYGPWRNPLLGTFWSVVGWTILLTCWVPFLNGGLLGAVAAFLLGQACRSLARKHRAQSAKAALEEDRRPPIVYLRSFQDDGVFHPGIFLLLNDWLRTISERTAEINLSEMLSPFGPVIAIGRPEEEMPEVGAARIYVGDDHWQELIIDLLSKKGAMAVLQAGGTKGLQWELKTVGTILDAEQILMFLPFGLHRSHLRRDASYADFCSWASECFRARLPEKIYDNEYFLYFTRNWKTRVVELEGRIPEAHQLTNVVTDLAESKKLQPWRLTNPRRRARLLLAGILLFPLSFGIKYWRDSIENRESAPPPTPAMNQIAPEPNVHPNEPFAKDPPRPVAKPVPPGGTAFMGKNFPYRLPLGPEWSRIKDADPEIDLHLKRGDAIQLLILAGNTAENLDDFPETYVKQLAAQPIPNLGNKTYDKVTLNHRGKARASGKEWLEIRVGLLVGKTSVWQHIRAYSGPEGTLLLIGAHNRDDAETREQLAEAMDAVEILPIRAENDPKK